MSQFAGHVAGAVGAIVVAAGSSTRMGGQDKVFSDLGGMPVIAHSVRVFETSPSVDRIVLVVAEPSIERAKRLVFDNGWTKVVMVCAGGTRRQDSVVNGLRHLEDCEWILIHDGARPFVTHDLLERGLLAALQWGAAIPVVPVKDTIKVVDGDVVRATLNRASLGMVQTPQFFRSGIIAEAYAKIGEDVTDDASLVEQLGRAVGVFEGSHMNIKITTPEDMAIARLFTERQERASIGR